MNTYTFNDDQSVFTVTSTGFLAWLEEYELTHDDITRLDEHCKWQDMHWWKSRQRPCLNGDDMMIGIGRDYIVAIFDCICSWWPRPADVTVEEILRRCCVDVDSLGDQL